MFSSVFSGAETEVGNVLFTYLSPDVGFIRILGALYGLASQSSQGPWSTASASQKASALASLSEQQR